MSDNIIWPLFIIAVVIGIVILIGEALNSSR